MLAYFLSFTNCSSDRPAVNCFSISVCRMVFMCLIVLVSSFLSEERWLGEYCILLCSLLPSDVVSFKEDPTIVLEKLPFVLDFSLLSASCDILSKYSEKRVINYKHKHQSKLFLIMIKKCYCVLTNARLCIPFDLRLLSKCLY